MCSVMEPRLQAIEDSLARIEAAIDVGLALKDFAPIFTAILAAVVAYLTVRSNQKHERRQRYQEKALAGLEGTLVAMREWERSVRHLGSIRTFIQQDDYEEATRSCRRQMDAANQTGYFVPADFDTLIYRAHDCIQAAYKKIQESERLTEDEAKQIAAVPLASIHQLEHEAVEWRRKVWGELFAGVAPITRVDFDAGFGEPANEWVNKARRSIDTSSRTLDPNTPSKKR